jgi:hypothetical protein
MRRDLLWSFFIDAIIERYDERRSETRKRTNHMALCCILTTPPHLAQSKFDLMGIHLLSHPPDSPDVAPYDF